ncbi:hypothetical protein DL766_002972 [Monosporascus sp. MC13-8B]|uniref:2-(3-amino-3-carboxypropyl)histidine synthase subunit 2 n=1 Tax=Monosporascus cannonballus TaxID=155416 RepID=A0ABY0HLU8_9PEZI|nr:hypothetical protein DL763_005878 [Monosporascus cannonballus]RYO93733.1 hypothetical protein DL762_000938 [Monosporascus cannonballus]RYP34451.1 hypothetical protein DL766_002972 [Monosporascus sp. MC13-8B]
MTTGDDDGNNHLSAPPVLSTPAEHTFLEDPTQTASKAAAGSRPPRTEDELAEVYEIRRTAAHIRDARWRRVALQFPDAMLPDAPWVVEALASALGELGPADAANGDKVEENGRSGKEKGRDGEVDGGREADMTTRGFNGKAGSKNGEALTEPDRRTRLYILADTSYSACCVDEIAAEHADADGVVHYGRACLSPTSRLPVLHIFTRQKLHYEAVAEEFEREFPEKSKKVVVMADVMFQEHVVPVCRSLKERGYTSLLVTEIIRDPGGTIPNRRVMSPEFEREDGGDDSTSTPDLKDYHLFHISTPPTSLLLTLSSRLASLRICPTPSSPYTTATTTTDDLPDPSATPALLRRRYGLVVRLATASIIGILVNTLSVKNYVATIGALRARIAAAGKKSYTVVVGKLNAAKLANFAEVDGWVVVGCWEAGLVEQDGLWKPVVTPFELALALRGEETRVWTGKWWGGIEGVEMDGGEEGGGVEASEKREAEESRENGQNGDAGEDVREEVEAEGGVSDEESAPPEFDLRTGKLVSHSRPMRLAIRNGAGDSSSLSSQPQQQQGASQPPSSSLVKRAKAGQLAAVNGVASPGAEYLRSQRTWQGLGSDFAADEASTLVEEGRSGVARGYTVGASGDAGGEERT